LDETKEGVMADSTSTELRQRRALLTESLPALSQKQDDTYRLNSNAVALDRAGVTDCAPQELERLREDEMAADAELRDVRREIRELDSEITSAAGAGLSARVGRFLRRVPAGG
jgi:hypothetical protein